MEQNFEKTHEQKVEESCRGMEQIKGELSRVSQFKRIVEPDGKEILISPEGERFSIECITNPDDPAVKEICSFMARIFKDGETDPPETIKEALETNWGDYHIIRNEKGELIAHSCSSYLNSRNPEGNTFDPIKPKQGILYIAYVLTVKEYEKKGLARELYQNAYERAIEESRKRQSIIKGIIGENVEDVENFLNKMNRKRLYFNDKEGNVQEVKYLCAPHDWDDEKAVPTLESVPEHLMYRAVDNRKEITTADVLSIVKTLYKENYILPTLKTEKAKEANVKLVLDLWNQLDEELKQAKDGKIFLMSANEREQKRSELEAKGKRLIDLVIEEGKELENKDRANE